MIEINGVTLKCVGKTVILVEMDGSHPNVRAECNADYGSDCGWSEPLGNSFLTDQVADLDKMHRTYSAMKART